MTSPTDRALGLGGGGESADRSSGPPFCVCEWVSFFVPTKPLNGSRMTEKPRSYCPVKTHSFAGKAAYTINVFTPPECVEEERRECYFLLLPSMLLLRLFHSGSLPPHAYAASVQDRRRRAFPPPCIALFVRRAAGRAVFSSRDLSSSSRGFLPWPKRLVIDS